ncbi:MAG: NAD(P)-dependent oxidoreductase [SAR202 cluster bacterium]|jgi:nucleoside-diphosphate-sugar epimerase|nr:NAD(P)-dependent oxidoreductase [SAR202 cluster bacterium]
MTGPVLITGGAGSVGRQLVELFSKSGTEVRVFDLPAMDFTGIEERQSVEVVKGDITDCETMARAVEGVGAVVHLAALLPPSSERDRDLTFAVNVGGAENVVAALESLNPGATMVFTSSVSTYGDTASETPPVYTNHPQSAIDIYADSKIVGEALVRASSLKTVCLRIAGIAVPAFLAPPDVWPFMPDQRVEMVHRDDVVLALFNSVQAPEAVGGVFNIAGGPSWQITGQDYVRDFYGVLGAPTDEAVYRESPGWVDWYDTESSERALRYQERAYSDYTSEMRALVQTMMDTG